MNNDEFLRPDITDQEIYEKSQLKPVDRMGAGFSYEWRLRHQNRLRTQNPRSFDHQIQFFKQCEEDASPHRFWSVDFEGTRVGLVGLTNLNWSAGTAEISVMEVSTRFKKIVVAAGLRQAFDVMRLEYVFGEVYECADWEWWRQTFGSAWESDDACVYVPARKFYGGDLWGAYLFWWSKRSWWEWVEF